MARNWHSAYHWFTCIICNNIYSLVSPRRITVRVRKLLLLIPTDPAVQEALDQLDSLGRKVSKLFDGVVPFPLHSSILSVNNVFIPLRRRCFPTRSLQSPHPCPPSSTTSSRSVPAPSWRASSDLLPPACLPSACSTTWR